VFCYTLTSTLRPSELVYLTLLHQYTLAYLDTSVMLLSLPHWLLATLEGILDLVLLNQHKPIDRYMEPPLAIPYILALPIITYIEHY